MLPHRGRPQGYAFQSPLPVSDGRQTENLPHPAESEVPPPPITHLLGVYDNVLEKLTKPDTECVTWVKAMQVLGEEVQDTHTLRVTTGRFTTRKEED